MLVLALVHLFEIVSFFDLGEFISSNLNLEFLLALAVFEVIFFILLPLEALLHLFEFPLLRHDCAVHSIVLLALLAHAHRYFFVFNRAALPSGHDIVGVQQSIPGNELLFSLHSVVSIYKREAL